MEFATPRANLQPHQTVGMATHGDDSGLYPEFDTRPVLMPFKSQEAGRPIYEDTPFITIHFPGDRTKRVERPVKLEDDEAGPSDCNRWPKHWAAFQRQQDQTSVGMPVTEWAQITKSQALELKGMNIHTLEQLSQLPDSACSWMGSRELRAKAKTWLETAAGHSSEAALQAVIERQNATIEALRNQLDDIVARIAERDAEQAANKTQGAAAAPAAKAASRRTPATSE